jgi:hypothetical protein
MAQIIIFTGVGFSIPFRSIGAYQIANQLRNNGYTVQVVEYFPQILKIGFDKFLSILDRHVDEETIWIGFSTTFLTPAMASSQQLFTKEQTEKIKNLISLKKSKCRFVSGGAKAFKRDSGELFDTYIEGYADISVINFTKWCEGKNPFFKYTVEDECVIVNDDITASTFNFSTDKFSWHQSDAVDYREGLPIEISRGCIFRCNFCSFPLNGKKKLDYLKETEILKNQFLKNYQRYRTTNYVYLDDTHNDSVEKLEILYDNVYSKLPFKINFVTYLRLDLLHAHPDTIPLLKESGLKVALFGIESLNDRGNKAIGKGLTREKIIDTLQHCKDIWGDDVFTIGNFMIGLPHEDKKSAEEWIEIVGSDTFKLDAANINPLFLDPTIKNFAWSSEFMKNPTKYGYSTNEQGWINNMGLTYSDAIEISKNSISYLESKNKKPTMRWGDTVGLAGLDYTWPEIRKIITSTNNTYSEEIRSRIVTRIMKYLETLLR